MWILLQYNHKIKSGFIRTFLAPLLIAGVTAAFIQVASSEEILGNYNLDNIEEVSKVTRDYILSSTGESGSTYTLGNIEPGLVGMIKKAPAAINVSLFRPYLWEARKPIVLLNALEASLFLFFTLKILFKLGPLKVWSSIRSDPNIQFCLIFSMIFGLAVGISSYNFGSLSRYRIPMLPLYALSLGLIWYRYKSERFTPFEGKS